MRPTRLGAVCCGCGVPDGSGGCVVVWGCGGCGGCCVVVCAVVLLVLLDLPISDLIGISSGMVVDAWIALLTISSRVCPLILLSHLSCCMAVRAFVRRFAVFFVCAVGGIGFLGLGRVCVFVPVV